MLPQPSQNAKTGRDHQDSTRIEWIALDRFIRELENGQQVSDRFPRR